MERPIFVWDLIVFLVVIVVLIVGLAPVNMANIIGPVWGHSEINMVSML